MGIKRIFDRKDGKRVRNLDAMHCIMPLIFPKRSESEVFIKLRIDLTNTNNYIRVKNAENPEFKYNLFQLIIAAILKTIVLRPHMNRFISNQNIYQRDDVSAAFIVKTSLSDDAEEAMAFIKAEETDRLDSLRQKIYEQIENCRDELQKDSSQKVMDFVTLLPGFIRVIIGFGARMLDRHGLMPKSVMATDIHYASVVLSQLGSIKLGAAYHHLTVWGTNSLFITVGEKKKHPFYDNNGNMTMKSSIDIGFTVDERISDGFYFAKSVRLMKKLLEHPELLEGELNTKVLY